MRLFLFLIQLFCTGKDFSVSSQELETSIRERIKRVDDFRLVSKNWLNSKWRMFVWRHSLWIWSLCSPWFAARKKGTARQSTLNHHYLSIYHLLYVSCGGWNTSSVGGLRKNLSNPNLITFKAPKMRGNCDLCDSQNNISKHFWMTKIFSINIRIEILDGINWDYTSAIRRLF